MRLVDTIKVIDSWVLSIGMEQPVTIIKLTKNAPNTHWHNVLVDDDLLETLYMTGGRLDMCAVKGSHNLTGKEISFV